MGKITMKKDINYFLDKAMAEEEKDNYPKALKYAKEAAKINPKDMTSLWKVATCYKCLGKFEQALMYYNKVLEINPIEIVSMVEKVNCLMLLKRNKDALKTFDSYLKLQSDKSILDARNDFYKWTKQNEEDCSIAEAIKGVR